MTAKDNPKGKGKQKGKSFRKGCFITLIILVLLAGIAGGIGWLLISKEQNEARGLPLNAVDFDRLGDGTYHGVYAGGMYQWRIHECDVTVEGGKVTDIQLSATQDPAAANMDYEMLNERVIQAQTLQVDTISSATLTSKSYLQCVENALIQAQHE